jgi:hypothetical protein
MDANVIMQVSAAVVCVLGSPNRTFRGFEFRVYEEACRTLEVMLEDFRKTWEDEPDEAENYTG